MKRGSFLLPGDSVGILEDISKKVKSQSAEAPHPAVHEPESNFLEEQKPLFEVMRLTERMRSTLNSAL